MAEAAELELGLHRSSADLYDVELRYRAPGSDADVRASLRAALPQPDAGALLEHLHDPLAYGRALTDAVFANVELRTVLAQARSSADSLGAPLRVRLFVAPAAPELHRVRW